MGGRSSRSTGSGGGARSAGGGRLRKCVGRYEKRMCSSLVLSGAIWLGPIRSRGEIATRRGRRRGGAGGVDAVVLVVGDGCKGGRSRDGCQRRGRGRPSILVVRATAAVEVAVRAASLACPVMTDGDDVAQRRRRRRIFVAFDFVVVFALVFVEEAGISRGSKGSGRMSGRTRGRDARCKSRRAEPPFFWVGQMSGYEYDATQ